MHSRQTHSYKVALVAREIAEQLLRNAKRRTKSGAEYRTKILSYGGLDVAAAEFAGLVHDVGHPPFGHAAEHALDRELRSPYNPGSKFIGERVTDGFEGNAQSFRIALRLDPRGPDEFGLGLCAVSLAAIQKYPRARGGAGCRAISEEQSAAFAGGDKFGAYQSPAGRGDCACDEHVRGTVNERVNRPRGGSELLTLEAAIMDLADDISYSVHDFEDFLSEGLLDVARLRRDLEVVIKNFMVAGKVLGIGRTMRGSRTKDSIESDVPEYATFEFHGRDDSVSWALVGGLLSEAEGEASDHNLLIEPAVQLLGTEPSPDVVRDVFQSVCGVHGLLLHMEWTYAKSLSDTAMLRETMSSVVGAFFVSIELRPASEASASSPPVSLSGPARYTMRWLKQISRSYILGTPLVALSERAQVRCIQTVFRGLEHWVFDNAVAEHPTALPEPLESLLPPRERRVIRGEEHTKLTWEARRGIADYICTLSDFQCLGLANHLLGVEMPTIGAAL